MSALSLSEQVFGWLIASAVGLVIVAMTPVGSATAARLVGAFHVFGAMVFYVSAVRALFLTASNALGVWLSWAITLVLSLFLMAVAGTPGLRSRAGLFQRAFFAIVIFSALRTSLS